MAESKSERVNCPNCDRSYRWEPSIVGRHVKCKQCQNPFKIPAAPGTGAPAELPPKPKPEPDPEPLAEDGTYEIDMDEDDEPKAPAPPPVVAAAQAVAGKCPSCNNDVREGAVLCLNCGFNMKEGKKIQTVGDHAPEDDDDKKIITSQDERDLEMAAAAHRQHRWTEIYLPLAILGIGLAFVLLNTFVMTPMDVDMQNAKIQAEFEEDAEEFEDIFGTTFTVDDLLLDKSNAMIYYIIAFALTVTMMLPLLLGGIFFMASVFGSSFGNLFTALLKLLAMTALVIGFNQWADIGLNILTNGHGWIGSMISLSIVFGLFYPLCTKLFDMDGNEIIVMFFIYCIGPIALGLLAMMMAMSMF